MAESVDLLPTFLDLLGLAPPPGLEGRSLRAAASGDESNPKPFAMADFEGQIFSIQDPHWKLIWNPGHFVYEGVNFSSPYTHAEEELYQLDQDPSESVNRVIQNRKVADDLKEQLKRRYADYFRLTPGKRALTAQEVRLLEKAGYLHWSSP